MIVLTAGPASLARLMRRDESWHVTPGKAREDSPTSERAVAASRPLRPV